MLKIPMHALKHIFLSTHEVRSIQLMNLTLFVLVCVLWTIDAISGIHMAALVGTTMLALTLIPARLLGLGWLRRIEPDLIRISYQGKWLGIWTCIWFVLYAIFAVATYYSSAFVPSQLIQRETILLSASLAIFVVLLSLSNRWSYAHVGWWKQINMLIWLAVPFLFTHLWLAAHIFGDVGYFWAPWTLLLAMAIAGGSGIFRKRPDYFAWWRIWLLVAGGLLSALVVFFYPAIV